MDNPAFAAIGDHDPAKGATVTVRLPPVLHAYLQAMAHDNERSLSDEIRAALWVHEHLHRVSLILDQGTQKARKAFSDGLHGTTGKSAREYVGLLRDEVAEHWAHAFPAAHRGFEQKWPDFLWREQIEDDRPAM